ncbi:hypothetical protein BB558_007146, partial [Smittium angustum]
MDEATAKILKDLTEKVEELLIEALPSIEEDFFRTPLTEEERRDVIYSYPRTSAMVYLPPPLNDSASIGVKKIDSMLYGIQVALAQATRPIDYYVHRRIQNSASVRMEDESIEFANTMRILLSDIAATVTQGRLDNRHRGIELSGKPPQIIETEVKPLMDQETFNTLLTSKKTTRKPRIKRLFCGHQQILFDSDTSSNLATAQTSQNATQTTGNNHPLSNFCGRGRGAHLGKANGQQLGSKHCVDWISNHVLGFKIKGDSKVKARLTPNDAPAQIDEEAGQEGARSADGGSGHPTYKESHRRGKTTKSRVLQPDFCNTEEGLGTETHTRLKEIERARRTEEFQNGISEDNMQIDTPEELYDVAEPQICVYTHTYSQVVQEVLKVLLESPEISVQSPTILTVPESTHLHKDTPPDIVMDEITGDPSVGLFGQPADFGRVKEEMSSQYGIGICKVEGTEIPDQTIEINNDTSSNHYSSRMVINSREMTLKIPPTKVRDLHREATNIATGEINAEETFGIQEHLSSKEDKMDINDYIQQNSEQQSQMVERPTEDLERHELYTGDVWKEPEALLHIKVKELLAIYKAVCLPAVVGRSALIYSDNTTSLAEDLVPLPGNEYPTTSDIRANFPKSCRCTKQAYSTNKVVPLNQCISGIGEELWETRRRSICHADKQEGKELLQLVQGQQGCWSKFISIQLERVEQRLLLSTMEPDSSGHLEGLRGTHITNISNTAMEDSNMVPGPTRAFSETANATVIHHNHTKPPKRKVTARQEQGLVADGMEDQWSVLKAQGFADTAINIIIFNDRSIKRRSRYYTTQRQFLDWRIANNSPNPISADQIVNYLAEIYVKRKLSPNSIKSYKSAIMHLVSDPEHISSQLCFKEFFKAINDTSIKSFVRPFIDISPVLSKLKEWGSISELDIDKLTTKVCWLLSMPHQGEVLILVIVAPKEKRKGSPIERQSEIRSHADPVLCPRRAFTAYRKRIAEIPCRIRLNVALSVDSITRHIHNLSSMISRPPGTPIPKAQAIGATLASIAGIPSDEIVSHGFCFTTNSSSSVGLYGNFGQANYSAAKSATNGFTRTLPHKSIKNGIRVNSLFIGFLCHNSCPDSGKIFQIGSCWAGKVCRQSTGGHIFVPDETYTPESIRDRWSVITNFDDGRAQWLTSSGDFNKVVVGNIMRVLNVKIGETSNVEKKITARNQNATIDVEAARKHVFQPKNFAFTERDVMLYAFGISASHKNLPLVYELSPKFHTFPTFPILAKFFCGVNYGEFLPKFNPMMLLHGEEFVQIHSPIPTSGNFVCTSQVVDIADKGKASA